MAYSQSEKFDIRDFIGSLTAAKGKNRYHCPNCDKNDFTINLNTGAYKCYSGGCTSREIRDAIAPLEKKSGNYITYSKKPRANQKKAEPKLPPPPPTDSEFTIVRLQVSPTDTPQPYKGFEKKHGEVSKVDYIYDRTENGEPLLWVTRTEYPDLDKPKGRSKKFCPCRRAVGNEPIECGVLEDGTVGVKRYAVAGETLYNKGSEPWLAYRLDEAIELAKQTPALPVILTIEGEKNTEIGRSHRLASITWQGSGWTIKDMTPTLERIKALVPNAILGFITDNDDAGRKKGEIFLKACAATGIYGIVIPSNTIDPEISEHGDIEQLLEKMNAEELIKILEEQIKSHIRNHQQVEDESIDADEPKEKARQSAPEIADEIAEDYRSKLCWSDTYRCWMIYSDKQHGIWSGISDEYLNHIILSICKAKGLTPTSRFVKEITALLQMMLIKCDWEQQAKVIPFRNGVLDIETKVFSPHAYHHYQTWCLPYDYNILNTNWDAIDNFLSELSGHNPQTKDLLIKFAAATLFGRCDLHKFLWLIGDAGTGKGTYTRLLELMIGVDNCAFPSLAELQEKDVIASLVSKRLIIISDQEKYPGSLTNFCKLTGGDTMSGRHLYKSRINFRYLGMIVGTSNQPIFHNDSGGRITRRLLMVGCQKKPVVIQDLEAVFKPLIPAFIAYLISIPQAEIESTLRGNQSNGGGITSTAWGAKIRLDSIAAWLNEEIIQDADAQSYIGSDRDECSNSDYNPRTTSLFGAYNRYCRQSGLAAKGKNNFSADLMDICKILAWKDVEKKRDGVGRVVVCGIRLRQTSDAPATIEELLSTERDTRKKSSDSEDPSEDPSEDLKRPPLRHSEDPEDLCSKKLEKDESSLKSEVDAEKTAEQSFEQSFEAGCSESSEPIEGNGSGSSDRSSDRSSESEPTNNQGKQWQDGQIFAGDRVKVSDLRSEHFAQHGVMVAPTLMGDVEVKLNGGATISVAPHHLELVATKQAWEEELATCLEWLNDAADAMPQGGDASRIVAKEVWSIIQTTGVKLLGVGRAIDFTSAVIASLSPAQRAQLQGWGFRW